MMVVVQKITAYAFAVHDGEKEKQGQLRIPEQVRHAIRWKLSFVQDKISIFSCVTLTEEIDLSVFHL